MCLLWCLCIGFSMCLLLGMLVYVECVVVV